MKLDLTGDENVVRMCVRVRDEPRPVKGSEVVSCDECGEPIWRDSMQVLRHPETGEPVTETHCLCPQCNFQHMSLSPDAKLVMPSIEDLFNLMTRVLSEDNDERR